MKITPYLISSMALLASASQAAILSTTTFDRTGNSLDSVTVNTQSAYGLSSGTSIGSTDFSKGGSPASGQSGAFLGHSTIPSTIITPNSNVASGGSWSMSFTFTNTSAQDMLISSIDLTMIGISGSGMPQNAGGGVTGDSIWIGNSAGATNKPLNLTMTIGTEAQTLTYNAATTTSSDAHNWSKPHEYRTGSYDFTGLTLGAGESLTIKIDASQNSLFTSGCFAGLSGIQINGELAPEPTTASLGLLGLTTLFMRRRRI